MAGYWPASTGLYTVMYSVPPRTVYATLERVWTLRTRTSEVGAGGATTSRKAAARVLLVATSEMKGTALHAKLTAHTASTIVFLRPANPISRAAPISHGLNSGPPAASGKSIIMGAGITLQ